MTYILLKKKFANNQQDTNDAQSGGTPVGQSSNKADVELQPIPVVGTSQKVTIDANPAYEIYE